MIPSLHKISLILLPGITLLHGQSKTIVDLPEPTFGKDTTTLAVLPDTQYYSQKYPHHFETQTQWIANHYQSRNISYMLHLGDIVQNDAPKEWEVAVRSLRALDGKVPYLLIPGNHDYSNHGRSTRLTEYFSVQKMEKWPTFGGVFEKDHLDNNYHLFRIGEQDWIALGLEYGPRKKTMTWANEVLLKHRNRKAIIVTHGYMFYNNTRYDHRRGSQRASPYGYAGDGADGEQLWNTVIRKHPNVMMVICGHVRTGGLGYRASEGDYGNIVHEMMANYQKMRGGGMAFMRLLEFHPDGETVQVRTFSPSTGEVRHSKLEEFQFKLQGATRSEPIPIGAVASRPLRKAPIHRYSFTGDDPTRLIDSLGNLDGTIYSPDDSASLNGKGQFILKSSDDQSGHARLSPKIIKSRTAVSMEMWVAPTAQKYDWDPLVRFAQEKDAFYYTFRTLGKHRAELIDNGHNEDIQRSVNIEIGKPLHIVMTYTEKGTNGKPEIASFIDGEENGRMDTSIKLSGLQLREGYIGPFQGIYDELRFYDYGLSPEEVNNNFVNGPNQLEVLIE